MGNKPGSAAKAIAVIAFLICFPSQVMAQDEEAALGRIDLLTFQAPMVQPCVVHLPVGYDPDKPCRLVVGLHGYGGNIDRFHTNWFAFDDPQFIYACPQAPYPTIQQFGMGFGWFLAGTGDPGLELQVIGLTHDYVLDIINQLKDRYKVSEVYLLGFSQGAMLGLLLAEENPGLVTGLGFISSRVDPWLAVHLENGEPSASFRVFAAHGTLDEDVKPEDGRKARDLLAESGLDVAYTEFEAGHTIPAAILREFQHWLDEEPDNEH